MLWAGAAHCTERIEGWVTYVNDGDSFFLRDAPGQRHEIRIRGIDAPERGQPYSRAARRAMQGLVLTQRVRVEFDKHDRYGRLVGRVTAHGRDVALAQLQSGMAWFDAARRAEQDYGEARRYAEAQAQARAQRRGLWHARSPLAPWEWRRRQRGEVSRRLGVP